MKPLATKRLLVKHEGRLLAILRAVAQRPFDERQACLDCAEVIASLPAAMAAVALCKSETRGRPREPVYMLAKIAAPMFHAHTGRGPSQIGYYPDFIAALADAAAVPYIIRLRQCSASREAERWWNAHAGNEPGSEWMAYRKKARKRALGPVSLGEDDDEVAVIEGDYEPAPDPELNGATVFREFVKDRV